MSIDKCERAPESPNRSTNRIGYDIGNTLLTRPRRQKKQPVAYFGKPLRNDILLNQIHGENELRGQQFLAYQPARPMAGDVDAMLAAYCARQAIRRIPLQPTDSHRRNGYIMPAHLPQLRLQEPFGHGTAANIPRTHYHNSHGTQHLTSYSQAHAEPWPTTPARPLWHELFVQSHHREGVPLTKPSSMEYIFNSFNMCPAPLSPGASRQAMKERKDGHVP